ncbi:MAG: hypothetical protein EXR41_05955 [Candidatus Methylopumilus sp.]|nr:hypothetical protein [Candidatus Methylopumilus sp.]
MSLIGIDMLKDKKSQNERIQYKCTSFGWDVGFAETIYDEIIGLHRCPNCSNYELLKSYDNYSYKN